MCVCGKMLIVLVIVYGLLVNSQGAVDFNEETTNSFGLETGT